MAPKNKGKKGKKQDDDDFWEKAGTSVAGNNIESPVDAGAGSDDELKPKKGKSGLSAFAALGLEEPPAEEEEEDFGGLMSVIKASQKGKKDKKDKKKDKKKGGADDDNGSVSFADGAKPGEGSDGEDAAAKGDISAPQKAVQMTAEELADEEWGPVKEKGKKGKKGKKKGKAQDDDEEDKPGEHNILSPRMCGYELPVQRTLRRLRVQKHHRLPRLRAKPMRTRMAERKTVVPRSCPRRRRRS
ncbi:hypothetical protein C8Q77DRAFT_378932 [Trametes polyzona]|nr:hypothetical protein C8Q77DRAFT_378932 [Trametes polyzona]